MALKKSEPELKIDALKRGRVTVKLIGETPFYYNAMSVKAKRDLLIGAGRKTAAQKKEIKHNPEQEFRDSVYKIKSDETLLGFPAAGVKGAMATAALETPGVTKTSVQRLIFIPHERIRIWGKPYLKMDVVRSADMNKTPDIRTRAYLPNWCAEVDIAFVTPSLSVHSVISLLTNAGMISGLGDFRQEKGKGSNGCFSVHGDDLGDMQPIWDDNVSQGREVQQLAMDNPECYDDDTRELMTLMNEERIKRAA